MCCTDSGVKLFSWSKQEYRYSRFVLFQFGLFGDILRNLLMVQRLQLHLVEDKLTSFFVFSALHCDCIALHCALHYSVILRQGGAISVNRTGSENSDPGIVSGSLN